MMDIRVKVYFILTTLNSLCDITSQIDDTIFCSIALLWRFMILYVMIAWNFEKTHTQLVTIAIAISHGSSALYWIYKAPHTWEANQWSVHTDIVMMIWMLTTLITKEAWNSRQQVITDASVPCTTIHEMFCCYYCAAAFFKLNTHFLNPDGSCATMFMAQHTTYYLSFTSMETLEYILRVSKPWAPIATIVVEGLMGMTISLGRILRNRFWTRIGLMIILYFHLIICLTPKPNDISNFGLICGSRLIVLLEPKSLEVAVQQYIRPYLFYITLLTLPIVAYGIQNNFTSLNWAFVLYMPVLILCQIVTNIESQQQMAPTSRDTKSSDDIHIIRPTWSRIPTVFAAMYAFGSLILGLQEEATPNMFSNLKVHGGSNHLIVPTGLLFHIFANSTDAHVYGGGVIRIEKTDSNWLQTIYPAELTHVLEPAIIVPLLTKVGHPPPIYFNPGANRVLGLLERGWVDHSGNIYQYTVPGMEFKRLFKEAIQKDRNFTLTFAQLPGTKGDEMWRAFAVRRRFQITVNDGRISSCTVQDYDGKGTTVLRHSKCDPTTDLPYQLHVPWWIQKIAMYHPYPIIFDDPNKKVPRKTITCFGP